jgi:hypothetical protein
MDNVLQHSNQPFGYVMGQIHQTSKHIAFCIFDPGIGIFNTLKGSVHAPRSHLDAITLAIKEGVTRDKAVGQGNGMWGFEIKGQEVFTPNSMSYVDDCKWAKAEAKRLNEISHPYVIKEYEKF